MPREDIRNSRSIVCWWVSGCNPAVAPSATPGRRSNRRMSLIETVVACFYQKSQNLPSQTEKRMENGRRLVRLLYTLVLNCIRGASRRAFSLSNPPNFQTKRDEVQFGRKSCSNISPTFSLHRCFETLIFLSVRYSTRQYRFLQFN